LALFGADPGPFYYDLGKAVGAQVCSVRGDGKLRSDWLPLLRNLCLWLSQPARDSGSPGGATERARFYVNPEYGNRDAIDWERPDISLPDSEISRLFAMHSSMWKEADWRALAAGYYRPFRFLVGAHTVRSGGKGTVAQWKAAARKAGLDGLIFREKILEMSEEQWEAFEAECSAASDDSFLAVPGQEFTDWEGNRFMRFNLHIPYHNEERLTKDKKRVKHQLHFFFDAGWPANFPLTVKQNPTAFWNYRVYSAFPIAVYKGGTLIEDNQAEWRSLVERMEYPTPLGVHLLEDPGEVAKTADDYHLILLAPSLSDIRDNPRWLRDSMGTGVHNSAAAYASNGPVIEAFLPLNMYRTTLGSRGVPGSYRYRILVRARSEVPIEQVELWGGGQCLRRYRPNARRFLKTVEELHDRQRGLFLRVVDARGREALATSIMVHDKMMVFYWCGDHANALPYGQGVDREGNPAGLGIVTHVKGMYQPAGGPGSSFAESAMYIPYGTDTSAPALGIFGELAFATEKGIVPASNVHYVPDLRFWYANRDVLITRMTVDRWADRNKYNPDYYGPYISGWGPYYRTEPLKEFEIVSDDIDLHRDAGHPALQLCRGEVHFKRELRLSNRQALNLVLGKLNWNIVKQGLYTADGPLPRPGRVAGKLGRGNYLTWPAAWGHGTIFALDDGFAVSAAVDEKGLQSGRPAFGYALGKRTFKPGDVFRYRFLIMRWPVGVAVEQRLDARVRDALNLARPDSGARIRAGRGAVAGTQVFLDLKAEGRAFVGELARADLGMRVPVRVAGLNQNWTAGLWHKGQQVFAPVGVDPNGFAWSSVDPSTEAGTIFIGNMLTCEEDAVILRLLQRTAGGWDVVAHNPLERQVSVTVVGTPGGPVPGLRKRLVLKPGDEVRWTLK